jgi:hypothetical protein
MQTWSTFAATTSSTTERSKPWKRIKHTKYSVMSVPPKAAFSGEDSQSNPNTIIIISTTLINAQLTFNSFLYSLFETSQTLFWAVFGLIELESFDLAGIKGFTRVWGLLMFGCFSVINIVVLLNLLIAMMNHSYQLIFVIINPINNNTFHPNPTQANPN